MLLPHPKSRPAPTHSRERLSRRLARALQLDFPTLEDSHSIQIALSMLVTALGDNRVDPARARTMLHALRVAAMNTRWLPALPRLHQAGTVSEAVLDETGNLIACDVDSDCVISSRKMMAEIDAKIAAQGGPDEDD